MILYNPIGIEISIYKKKKLGWGGRKIINTKI